MTSIDPRHRLAATLQQVGGLQGRRRLTGASSKAATQLAAEVLMQRLRALDASDPQRRHKAVRLYLESAFAGEFGNEVLNDPAFEQMVEAVQSQMQEDPEIAAAMEKAADLLLSR